MSMSTAPTTDGYKARDEKRDKAAAITKNIKVNSFELSKIGNGEMHENENPEDSKKMISESLMSTVHLAQGNVSKTAEASSESTKKEIKS